MDLLKKGEIKRTFYISFVCIFAYFVSYYIRNLLSVSTPEMLTEGFTKEFIGTLSSVYMLVYAIGQLVNGILGDIIRPKYMAFAGLFVGGAVCVLFSVVDSVGAQLLLFGVLGFSLSMLRGPLVKTICENVKAEYAHIACVFLSFICSAGPLAASIFSIIFNWKMTFTVAGASGVFFALVTLIILTVFEKKGYISDKNEGRTKRTRLNVLGLFKLEHFFFYMIVGMIGEISHTTIGFWLPTYLSEHLGFTPEVSGVVFSAVSLIKALAPFAALIVLRLFGNNSIRMTAASLLLAALFFLGAFLIGNAWINIGLILLALISIQLTSTLLWSVYIPDQGKSGLVSSLNGFLDFSGYLSATLANLVFSFTMAAVGWGGIIIMWCSISAFGALVSLFVKKSKRETV